MPMEKIKEIDKNSKRVSESGEDLNSLAGKKRKKKKKEKISEALNTGGVKEKTNSTHAMIRDSIQSDSNGSIDTQTISTDSGKLVHQLSSTQLKEDRCSSSSSIENSKPKVKIGRFDYSSSDAMSVSGHTTCNSASSSTVMETGTNGDSSHLFTASKLNMSVSASIPASDVSASYSTTNNKETTDSLRWDHECSDEEKEKERIEIYKENRRKRYENALLEKKAALSLHGSNKLKYYT